jgi:DNA mismatch endonuclease (patch repair protein)
LRIDLSQGRVRPDIVFTRRRVAVFVDGCFWHCCPEHGSRPKVNTDYWGPKLDRNRTRDLENSRTLERDGWVVIRVWEHVPPSEAFGLIVAALNAQAAPS